MKGESGQRFLMIYSGVLTAVFAMTLLGGLVTKRQKSKFDQIDVQRINVREPDGTLRMVISDKTRFPGLIIRGKEYPHPRLQAGMLFFNDEGTENGGLIFGGHKDKDGKIIDSGGSVTFDQYEQDQIVQIEGSHDSNGHFAGLVVFDRPDRPIEKDLQESPRIESMSPAERERLMAQRAKNNYYGAARIKVARTDDGAAGISLRDAQGRSRIVIQVSKDGLSSLKFLDADGKVLKELTPTSER
jgi:hypothetical protein